VKCHFASDSGKNVTSPPEGCGNIILRPGTEAPTVEATSCYRLAGLRIVSEFQLFGLEVCANKAAAHDEIVIRRASISDRLAPATLKLLGQQYIGEYNGSDVLLDFHGVARFLVRGGKEILVDPAPDSGEAEVRAYLVSIAFAALFHQRGLVPLHASAIDFADACVAFVGDSGAGKSTLAAALSQKGHEVITDDVCFVQLDDKRNVQAFPGIGRIRLWETAVYALGCDGPDVEQEMHGFNKYFIPIRPPRNPSNSRPLSRVYQLEGAPERSIEITRLRGAAAVDVFVQNVYQSSLAKRLGYKPHVFNICAAAARNVPVFRFSRPRDFHALAAGIEVLEDHIRNN
jgi:hypothetical protein